MATKDVDEVANQTTNYRLPRIIVRDVTGRVLDTDSAFQRAILEARQRLAAGETALTPAEWRLPHAPVPARPDFSRAPGPPGPVVTDRQLQQEWRRRKYADDSLKCEATIQEAWKNQPRLSDNLQILLKQADLQTLSKQDLLHLRWNVEQLERIRPLDAATIRRMMSSTPSHLLFRTYLPSFVLSAILHERGMEDGTLNSADMMRCFEAESVDRYFAGSQKIGFLCYGCDRYKNPHYHFDKAMKTGGGFTYFKRDRPLVEIMEKNPLNWKVDLRYKDDGGIRLAEGRGARSEISRDAHQWRRWDLYEDLAVRADRILRRERHRRSYQREDMTEEEEEERGDDDSGEESQMFTRPTVVSPQTETDFDSGRGETLVAGSGMPDSQYGDGMYLGEVSENDDSDKGEEEEEEEGREEKEQEETDTRRDGSWNRRERLYNAPPPFRPKRPPPKRLTVARSPFSTNRTYNIRLGHGFRIRKSDKKLTEFVVIHRNDDRWNEPDKFKLKQYDHEAGQFVLPKKHEEGRPGRRIILTRTPTVRPISEPVPKTPDTLKPLEKEVTIEIPIVNKKPKKRVVISDRPDSQDSRDASPEPSSGEENRDSGVDTRREEMEESKSHAIEKELKKKSSSPVRPARKIPAGDEEEPEGTGTRQKPELKKQLSAKHRTPSPQPETKLSIVQTVDDSEDQLSRVIPRPSLRPPQSPIQDRPLVRFMDGPPLPKATLDLPGPLPEYTMPEKPTMAISETTMEGIPEIPEPPHQNRLPPAARLKMMKRSHKKPRRVTKTVAPISKDDLRFVADPLDFLARYCIIHSERLPVYERVFYQAVSAQRYKYEDVLPTSVDFQPPERFPDDDSGVGQWDFQDGEQGDRVMAENFQVTEKERQALINFHLLDKATNYTKTGISEADVLVDRISGSLDLLLDKYEQTQKNLAKCHDARTTALAELAMKRFPGDLKKKIYRKQAKNVQQNSERLGSEQFVVGTVSGQSDREENDHEAMTSSSKPKKSKKEAVPSAKDILKRLDSKMLKVLNEDPAIRSLNVESERLEEKLKEVDDRIEDLEDQKRLLHKYCRHDYDAKMSANIRPPEFRRAQSALYQHIHPAEDVELNFSEVEEALQRINGQLLNKRELEFIYYVLDLPGRRRINVQLFSAVAALSEKVAQVDPFIKKLISKLDFNALNVKMDRSKELFCLLCDEEENKSSAMPVGRIGSDSLAVELTAGGVTEEHVRYVLSKFTRDKIGEVDFLDFLTYVPLFIELHSRIVDDPLKAERDL